MAIFTILYGNYYPPHGEFKLICIGKFARRAWVNFTQRYGKNRQRCEQNNFTMLYGNYCYIFIENFPQKFSPSIKTYLINVIKLRRTLLGLTVTRCWKIHEISVSPEVHNELCNYWIIPFNLISIIILVKKNWNNIVAAHNSLLTNRPFWFQVRGEKSFCLSVVKFIYFDSTLPLYIVSLNLSRDQVVLYFSNFRLYITAAYSNILNFSIAHTRTHTPTDTQCFTSLWASWHENTNFFS